MKKLLLLSLLFSSLYSQAQIIKIDIDSIADNQAFVVSKKWGDTRDTVRIVEYKVNGQVYGDSLSGNFNITIEWHIDSSRAVKKAEAEIRSKREMERDKIEDALKRFYKKNPDIPKPKKSEKLGIMGDIPKNYEVTVKPPPKRKKK